MVNQQVLDRTQSVPCLSFELGIEHWALGTGDWGLGTGDWGLGLGRNFSIFPVCSSALSTLMCWYPYSKN
ncbi:hypothetical protein FNW02_04120 [Komarekiella sp. 'clone 1']|uniref:Uncharacterized protein n=1 Tax=Komarekiella delphini-convector SJRDD-AB1 TaxID=2593771 RepID=A0AA40VP89_9NOST|nr:hypothetical protein [Komarekiella delphini-convector SJRDD-AB1]